MSNTSQDLSKLLEPGVLEALKALSQALRSIKCPYILVGATARMLMLDRFALQEGSQLIRRTRDIDAAVQVAGSGDFLKIKKALVRKGFVQGKSGTPGKAGGLLSGAASKAVALVNVVKSARLARLS